MTKNLLSVYALHVTELQDFFAYIQGDSRSTENNNFDLPPTLQKTPGSIIMKKQINCNVDKLNDWPRSGDSDIPPVTHARDLRSAPVAPLIPYVSIRMLDSL